MFLTETDIQALLLTVRLAATTTLILFIVGTPLARCRQAVIGSKALPVRVRALASSDQAASFEAS